MIASPSTYPYRRRVKDYKIVGKLIFLRGSCASQIIRSVYSLFFFLTPYSHGSGQNSERRLVETVYCAFRLHGIFQTAHLNLRQANIIFARQKCFYLYDSTLLERVSTHDLARFCTSCANRFACLCFKSASKVSPPLSLFGSHFIFASS